MSKTPWLSVVIPVYRSEHSVSQAIASVTAQGVHGVEIICVDDCSPDDSARVIETLQKTHPTLRLIRHGINQGPGPARNSGIDVSTGDYIVFLDADDSLIDGGLRQLKEKTLRSPDLIMVACEEIRRGKVRGLTDGPLKDSLSQTPLTNVSDEPRILFWPPAPWSKAYRREFLTDNHIRFGDGMAEDIPWSARVTLLAKTVALCDSPVYRYVTAEKDSSVTTRSSEKNMAIVSQVARMREQSDLDGLGPAIASNLAALAAIHLIWPNRAAYRLLPEYLRQQFFQESAAELGAWLAVSEIPPTLDSRPLMGAVDRTLYVEALASGDWALWQRTLARQAQRKAFRRFFRPGKVFGKK
jgi:glycosyltransferase involved in cell wall biosynthesis